MSIAFVDAGGQLLHVSHMDGARPGSIDVALKKAPTSAPFPVPTATLGEISQPGGPVCCIEHSNGGLISFGDGLPITDAEGRTLGAAGISGGTAEQGTEVADAVRRAD